MIKGGIEKDGPTIIGAPVTVGDVSVSPLTGKGELKQIAVGNPQGFRANYSLQIPLLSAAAKTSSIMSDLIVIKSIQAQAVRIFLEGGPAGTNVAAIIKSVNDYADSRASSGKGKRLQIDELIISDPAIELSVSAHSTKTLPLRLSTLKLGGYTNVTPDAIALTIFTEVMKAIKDQALPQLSSFRDELLSAAPNESHEHVHAGSDHLKDFLEKN